MAEKIKKSVRKAQTSIKKGKNKAKRLIIEEKEKVREIIYRCRCPNNNLFSIALISVIVFLFVEVVSRIQNLYQNLPDIDIITHFFGGIALGMVAYWYLSLTLVKTKRFTAIIYTLVGASIWEILETLEEMVIDNPLYLHDPFIWDGFTDVIVTTLGGVFALYVLRLIKDRTKILDSVH